jgi:hypothetical protein
MVPVVALFIWAARQSFTPIFWLLFAVFFVAGFTVQAYGPIVPRTTVTMTSVANELGAMKWSRSFIILLSALAGLIFLLVLYANS